MLSKIKTTNSFNFTNIGASLYCEKKELDCLQCLNKVKRWSLFVFAWNFTKRAKICAHFQIRLQLKIWEHLKILLSKRVTEKNQFGCKFNPGWKKAVAKDEKVVWFYILVFAQSPHIHQLERTKRFISWFSLEFDQIFYSEATRFILLIPFAFQTHRLFFIFKYLG